MVDLTLEQELEKIIEELEESAKMSDSIRKYIEAEEADALKEIREGLQ